MFGGDERFKAKGPDRLDVLAYYAVGAEGLGISAFVWTPAHAEALSAAPLTRVRPRSWPTPPRGSAQAVTQTQHIGLPGEKRCCPS